MPTGRPVPSIQTFMVEGAVPYLGDLLIQVALLVDVQLRVAPPVLLMEKDPYEGQQKPRTMVRPSHQAGCASSITVRLRAIVEAASVRLSVLEEGWSAYLRSRLPL